MTDPLAVPPPFRHQVLRRQPDAGGDWLTRLPDLGVELGRRWRLQITGPPRWGGTALVLPVLSPFGPAAWKLTSPLRDAGEEAEALTIFDGRGAVRCLDVDHSANALLLEWLPGGSLDSLTDRWAAVRIAGEVAGRLAQAVAPSGSPSLAAGSTAWKDQLGAQHAAAIRTGSQVGDRPLSDALMIIDELATDRTPTLTHGDLSPDNVIGSATGGWRAIDPLLLAGTAAHEAHTVVRGQLAEILAVDDPVRLMQRRTRAFTRAAGVDLDQALRLSFARYVASYYAESQHRGDPADVERLRRAVDVSARLL